MKRTRRVNVIYQRSRAAAAPHLEPADVQEGGEMGIRSTWMLNAEAELTLSGH